MATQRPSPSTAEPDLSLELLRNLELAPRARVVANYVSFYFPTTGVVVYVLRDGSPRRWVPAAVMGNVRVHAPHDDGPHGSIQDWVAADDGTLGLVYKERSSAVMPASQLTREDTAHLEFKQSIASLAYVPLFAGTELVGAVEIISFQQPTERRALGVIEEVADVAGAALQGAMDYESERNAQMQSISRLTQLYDLERVFNSTLHMARLLPLIASKVREIMNVEACNVWMVQDDDLILLSRAGEDATVAIGTVYKSGDGVAADVGDTGKAVLITRSDDARISGRNSSNTIGSLLAVPITSEGYLVGVIEVMNGTGGRTLDDEDHFLLATVMPTVANALHNASLIEAERKLETLDTLVEVSREITSTLNLERILQLVVNGPQKMMTYDRASIALEHHGKLQLKAISGRAEINAAEPATKRLQDILEWASASDSEVYVVKRGPEVIAEREETRLKFQEYFGKSGFRGFYAVPLVDEQGELGVLAFESNDPDFLTEMHFDVIKVLASQTTVALRNASLYTEVPFIGILEPLMQKKQAFLKMEKRRRTALVAAAVAMVAFLIFVPLPMRVVGDAVVAPESTAQVQAPLEAVISKVYVREGERVSAGTVLAEMNDWEFREGLAAAQAKYGTALAAMNRALAANDGAEAGVQRSEVEYWKAEVGRATERLEHTRLRSPIEGVVATPHMEEMVGRKLAVGDAFATIVNTERAQVDVAIDEEDVPLLRAGERAAVKVDSYPTRRFTGGVRIVSPVSAAAGEKRVFYARVDVPNEGGLLRPGMQGRSKVSTGWRPAGYVLLRPVGMWIWNRVWSWFGW